MTSNYTEGQEVKSVYVFVYHIHNTYRGSHAMWVCGVYDLCMCLSNTYTPLNYLINNSLCPDFYPRVRVLCLILKKVHLLAVYAITVSPL